MSKDLKGRRRAMVWRLAAAMLGFALVYWAGATPAAAQLQLCNKSSTTGYVAVGRWRGGNRGGWISEGWFQVRAGRCETVVGGRLNETTYYLYVDGADGRVWSGDDNDDAGHFCVHERDRFSAPELRGGDESCEGRGLVGKNFWRVEVGDATTATEEIVDGQSSPTPSTTPAPAPTPNAPAPGAACQRFPNLC